MCMMPSASSQQGATLKYVCGIDVGSQSCAGCVYKLDKSLVVKPLAFANRKEGWNVLLDKRSRLDALPEEILSGMEATACGSREPVA
jgi:transposase